MKKKRTKEVKYDFTDEERKIIKENFVRLVEKSEKKKLSGFAAIYHFMDIVKQEGKKK